MLLGAVLGASCTIGGQLASRRRSDAQHISRHNALIEQVELLSSGFATQLEECQALGYRLGEQSTALTERMDSVADGLARHEGQLNKLVDERQKRDEALQVLSTQLQQLENYTISKLAEIAQPRPQPKPPAPAAAAAAAGGDNPWGGVGELAAMQRAAQAEFARRQRAAAEAAFQVPPGGGQ